MLCFQVGPEGQGPLPTSALDAALSRQGDFLVSSGHTGGLSGRQATGSGFPSAHTPPPSGWQYGNRTEGQVADLSGSQEDPLFPSRLRTAQPRKWALEWSFVGEQLQALAIPEQASMDGVGVTGVSPSFLWREEAHPGSSGEAPWHQGCVSFRR